jgi:prevent-host-death family protein
MKTVSAAEANRQFSKLIREAAAGEQIVVTSHGRRIVKIIAISDEDDAHAARRKAKSRLLARLTSQPFEAGVPWSREDLYEDRSYPETG